MQITRSKYRRRHSIVNEVNKYREANNAAGIITRSKYREANNAAGIITRSKYREA